MKKADNKKDATRGKYQVPEDIKERARSLVKDFMTKHGVNASGLALKLKELDANRSDSRTNILNKLARASFQLTELIQIADLFDCELKIVPKTLIEPHEKGDSKLS